MITLEERDICVPSVTTRGFAKQECSAGPFLCVLAPLRKLFCARFPLILCSIISVKLVFQAIELCAYAIGSFFNCFLKLCSRTVKLLLVNFHFPVAAERK